MHQDFNYNDEVVISSEAAGEGLFGKRGVVVAVIKDRNIFPFPSLPKGIVYTVEFDSGDAVDVSEWWIVRA